MRVSHSVVICEKLPSKRCRIRSSWNLINNLHTNAQMVIKWDGQLAEQFDITQGVWQGGILSTDLYKVYENPPLDRLDGIDQGRSAR